MIGNFKVLRIVIILLLLGCKKQNETEDSRKLITQNINVLIDSVESFDISKMPVSSVSHKDFKNYKPLKVKQMTIGLLDSILVKENKLNKNNETNYLRFNLQKEDLVNFKSHYKIEIVKVNNYDTNVLFVSFFNFSMKGNKSSIEVKKRIGISMIHHKYYFEKENDTWVFKKKEFFGMG
ncbi:hypothetical protein [Flavobacterium cheongpyeongense]|nr:hypothetical protein [Flavobacterium cheongpyeongense]